MATEIKSARDANTNDRLREALRNARCVLDFYKAIMLPPHLNDAGINDVIAQVDAALALPRRQCDVGTPDEQVERWNNESLYPYEWDDRQYLDAQEVLKWAQMPYEADAQKGGEG